jgi:hypothetical protein
MSDGNTASGLLSDSFSEAELAAEVKKSEEQVRRWRRQRIGPRFFLLGRTARYPKPDARAWIAAGGTAPRHRRGRR